MRPRLSSGNTGAVVGDAHFGGFILAAKGLHKNVAARSIHRFAGVLEQINKGFVTHAAAAANTGEIITEVAMHFDRKTCACGKNLGDRLLQFLAQIKSFDMPFAQLSITHYLRNDSIRTLHLLLNDSNVLGRIAFSFAQRPFQ